MARLPRSEPALVRTAAQCSADAFTALLERHRQRLRMIARKYSATLEDREDLTQDVIAGLLNRRKKALCDWRPTAPFAAYLTTIASRRGIRFAQQQARLPERHRRALPDDPPEPWETESTENLPAPDAESPDRRIESAERATLVRQALRQLSERDQLVIRLRYFQDLDGLAIAKLLGVSHNAARRALFRAMRRLERLLDPHAEAVFAGL